MMIIAIAIGVVAATAITVIAVVAVVEARSNSSNGLVTVFQNPYSKEKKAPTTNSNDELTEFRRDVVISALSDIIGLDKYDIDERITESQDTLYSEIFNRTGCIKASEEHVSYVAEKSMWVKLLEEHGKSIRKYPWIFGDIPPVWEKGMLESSYYAEYVSRNEKSLMGVKDKVVGVQTAQVQASGKTRFNQRH